MTTQQDTPVIPNRRMFKELINNPTGRIPYLLADDPDAPIPYTVVGQEPDEPSSTP